MIPIAPLFWEYKRMPWHPYDLPQDCTRYGFLGNSNADELYL
jgi:hypothetical protein